MESQRPQFTPVEKLQAPESAERHWKIFDVFKKNEQDQPKPEAQNEDKKLKTEAAPEHRSPEQHRSIGKKIMNFLRGERPEHTPKIAPTTEQPQPLSTPESMPQPPIVERAKSIGRNVLQLIKRATGEVQQADAQEHVAHPVDIEPLAEAEKDVHLAMHELLAPVLAVEIPKVVRVSLRQEKPAQSEQPAESLPAHQPAPETQSDAVADIFANFDGDAPASFFEARTKSVAVAVAEVVAHAAFERHERRTPHTLRLQKVGIFALGAATAIGFMHTWHRIREVKKEQRELQKEYKRFEADVRQTQAVEAAKLHALEQAHVESMSRRERQQYVHEVSEFAHEQADEIRDVAHSRQTGTTEAVASVTQPVETVTNRPVHSKETVPTAAPQPQLYETFQPPVVTTERRLPPQNHLAKQERVLTPVAPNATPESHFGHKTPEQLKKAKASGGSGGAFGTAIMAAGTKVATSLLGTVPKQLPINDPVPTVQQPYVSPAQGWLFLCALAAGTIAVVLFVVGIL